MTVLFRTDASPAIGTGHVMRCLGLAERLTGRPVVFVAREMFPGLARRIEASGAKLIQLPPAAGANDRPMPHARWLKAPWQADAAATRGVVRDLSAEWIIVDHYALDAAWQDAVRTPGLRIAALDDLADRPHRADLLVDPNLSSDPYGRYRARAGVATERLLGPRYAILRPEFANAPDREDRSGAVRWLVAFGGVDAAGLTVRALEALDGEANVDVVVGGQNGALAAIKETVEAGGQRLHVDSDRMGALMGSADIAIGAGGHMLWERAAMGLPSIAVVVAENQAEQVREAARLGVVVSLDAAAADPATLRRAALGLAGDAMRRSKMSRRARAAVDGGGADRIARRIAAAPVTVRPAETNDRASMLAWRNHPDIRATARDPGAISPDTHARWFDATLARADRRLLIGEDAVGAVGVVRFDLDRDPAEVSIYLAPDRLGEGRGAALLLAAEATLRPSEATALYAETLEGNLPSAALFMAAGYAGDGRRFTKQLGQGA